MIKFRMSYSLVFFFLLAIYGISVAWCFALAGLFELFMVSLIVVPLMRQKDISTYSWKGILISQYSDGDNIDPTEMLHIAGARVLSALLGFLGVWFYIPAVIVFLTTITDFVPATKNKKPRK